MRDLKGRFIKGHKPTNGFQKGFKPWNNGLRAINDDRIKFSTDKAHRSNVGRPPWNKGIKIDRIKYPEFGNFTKHTKESKNKISASGKGKISPFKGKKFPQFSGDKSPFWKGGKTETVQGYAWIYCPCHPRANHGYVYEHRLVVENIVGRKLTSDETVHHLGNRNDNRPHKLMCFINDSAHMRFHKNPSNVKPEEIIFDGRSTRSP